MAVTALVFGLLGMTGVLHAATQTIYSDTLIGSGALNGVAATVANGVAGGTAGATWISGATKTSSGVTYTSGKRGFLPFTPQSGYTYTLTATVQLTGASDWVSLGFATTSASGRWHTTGTKYAWALVRNSGGGAPQSYAGSNTNNLQTWSSTASGQQTLIITLDTTGANWKTYATIGGVSSTTFTYSSNPTSIAYVGFGMDTGGTAKVRDFSLTATSIVTSHSIKGTVTSGGNPLAGATVYYSLTSGGPYSTTTTASDGTYSILVSNNTGPYYIKAGKDGYITSAEYSPAPSVGTTDVTGINFSLTQVPTGITWGPATTVSADGEVLKAGTLVYAVRFYSGTNTDPVINGVTFTSPGANLTLPSPWNLQNGLGAPASFSAGYQQLLGSDSWSDGTLTLNGLTSGRTYALQVWANDARGGASNQIETVTMSNSVNLNKNINGTGYGQYAYGTFTAAATTQAFTIAGGAFNALQLRLLPGSTLHFIRGTVTPGSATVYYSTTSGGPYASIPTATDGTYSFPVSDNTTYYVKAGKAGYNDSNQTTVVVGTADVTGVNFTLSAPSTVTVSGTVSDTSGGISGATVFYSTSSSGPFSSSYVTAASNGTYSFTAYQNTTYYVKAGSLGHLTSTPQSVSVGTSNVTGVNITLTKSIVANPDFADNGAEYTTYPGYSTSPNPTAPMFWTVSDTTRVGVNGAPGVTVFGPDTQPSGYWAFLQSIDTSTSIKQNIATTSGHSYVVTYSIAARSGYGGTIRAYISSDGGTTDIAGLTSSPSTDRIPAGQFRIHSSGYHDAGLQERLRIR